MKLGKFFTPVKKIFSKLVLHSYKGKIFNSAPERKKLFDLLSPLGVFPINYELSESTINELRHAITLSIMKYNHKTIYLLIDSGGGGINTTFKFYDFLKGLNSVKIVGIVNGKCASAAILILAACHKRLSFKHSSFLLHGIRRERVYISSLSKNLDEIFAKQKESFKEMFSFYDSTILSSFPISADDYHEFSNDGNEFERFFHSKKALELGIIDEIIEKFPF